MYLSNYLSPYVNVITILVFVIPFVLLCIKKSTFRPFTFRKLTVTFNWTLFYYAIISLIFLVTMKIIDVTVYEQEGANGNDFTEVVIGVGYSYVVIGAFFYVPTIGLLNLVNLTINKILKQRSANQNQ